MEEVEMERVTGWFLYGCHFAVMPANQPQGNGILAVIQDHYFILLSILNIACQIIQNWEEILTQYMDCLEL